MRISVLIIICSLSGILGIFLPWLHYPQADMKLYGYVGDGALLGLVFLSTLIFSFFPTKFPKFFPVYAGLAGLLIFALGFYNIYDIRDQQANFTSENIGINMAAAGFYEGVGLYVCMFSGLGLFLGGLILLLNKKSIDSIPAPKTKFSFAVYGLGLAISIATLAYFLPERFNINAQTNPEELKGIIHSDINKMVKALEANDFATYSQMVHPILAKRLGGEEMLRDFFEGIHRTFQEDKIKIEKITVDTILDIKSRNSDTQALFVQKVTFSQNGRTFDESQKTLAINDHRSRKWKYVTLGNDKNLAEIKKMFPDINEELKNLEN